LITEQKIIKRDLFRSQIAVEENRFPVHFDLSIGYRPPGAAEEQPQESMEGVRGGALRPRVTPDDP
jgi:hypothetical protein